MTRRYWNPGADPNKWEPGTLKWVQIPKRRYWNHADLFNVSRRIREALDVDDDGAATVLVWVRPDVAEKLIFAGLAVRAADSSDLPS